MVINEALKIDKLPEFIQYFLSSKYVAYWLGVKITQIDEIREYAIENILDVDTKFLKIIFAEYQLKEVENNFDDRIKVEDVGDFVKLVIEYYDELEEFFDERGEFFYVEFVFQVPFIWNSRFSREERESFLLTPKARYYATIRKNYIGRLILIDSDIEILDLISEDECFIQFRFEESSGLNLLLAFPKYLKEYWLTITDRIIRLSGYSIPLEIGNCR